MPQGGKRKMSTAIESDPSTMPIDALVQWIEQKQPKTNAAVAKSALEQWERLKKSALNMGTTHMRAAVMTFKTYAACMKAKAIVNANMKRKGKAAWTGCAYEKVGDAWTFIAVANVDKQRDINFADDIVAACEATEECLRSLKRYDMENDPLTGKPVCTYWVPYLQLLRERGMTVEVRNEAGWKPKSHGGTQPNAHVEELSLPLIVAKTHKDRLALFDLIDKLGSEYDCLKKCKEAYEHSLNQECAWILNGSTASDAAAAGQGGSSSSSQLPMADATEVERACRTAAAAMEHQKLVCVTHHSRRRTPDTHSLSLLVGAKDSDLLNFEVCCDQKATGADVHDVIVHMHEKARKKAEKGDEAAKRSLFALTRTYKSGVPCYAYKIYYDNREIRLQDKIHELCDRNCKLIAKGDKIVIVPSG
tara:strand:- start:1586 stop:2842 length:1257 start_codon:yes stop_codon:yes gene_type:complete